MSHVNPFISDPWTAVQTVIDSSKDKVERIHAGLGVVDFAAVTFIPHDHPPMMAAQSAKTEEELCAELASCCPKEKPKSGGVAAAAFPWQVVFPLVMALLKKWLNF